MKISVVMQTFLGDYPGSRSQPEKKFIRAVNSFLNQTHKDKELIIVADGCSIAPEVFYNNWSSNKEIKFIYLHKNSANMYDNSSGKLFYRGLPRRLGCSAADGDIITYMDSDDIILSNRLSDIDNAWKNKKEDIAWAFNPNQWWLEKEKYGCISDAALNLLRQPDLINLKDYGIDKNFRLLKTPEDLVLQSSWTISHRKNISVAWEDSYEINEDVKFSNNLMNTYKEKHFRFDSATYVLCHYRYEWDE